MRYGYDLRLYEDYGVKVSVALPPSHTHALITGASGSGKSWTLLYLIGSLLHSNPDTIIFLCDFKSSHDFDFLRSYKYYYSGTNCYNGIMEYYEHFNQARENASDGLRYILVAEEYPAFLTYLDSQDKVNKTKKASDILSAVSEILMMGRGTGNGFGFWCVTQRADSSWFSYGSRDNFMLIISLGRLSREQKAMLFSGEDIPERVYKSGQGLLLADGQALKEVAFPLIKDVGDWKRHILSILSRNIAHVLN